ncbi:hypothetical protein JYT44_01295 [Caldithrix abyssi]|nr:hypothetical protein [Caldithrix abyssi]
MKHYGSKEIMESQIKIIADENNIVSLPYIPQLLGHEKPDALIVMNDWGGWPKRAVNDARKMNIPTIGHVEGAQDYLDTYLDHGYPGERRYPYNKVDYVFLLGEYDKQFFKSQKTKVTGSPRFDGFLNQSKKSLEPVKNLVGINCNFSYGLYADIAKQWIVDIVEITESLPVKYQISQHIGDITNLSELNVYQGGLYDMINKSAVFVSRFSTAIMEALLLGCPAIYYNPHKEMQPTFLDAMGAFPTPTNKIELKDSLIDVLANSEKWLNRAEKFLDFHVANRDGSSANIFGKELIKIAKNKGKTTYHLPIRSYLKYMVEFTTRKLKQ